MLVITKNATMTRMQIANQQTLSDAAKHLSVDPVLAPVIVRAGLPKIAAHTNYYWAFIDSIISQQLSVKATATIEKRFKDLFDTDLPEPSAILAKSVDELRTAGLSNAKANYIRDLAQHILDGKIQFDKFTELSNRQIIDELVAVKGIGEWTAHMFLMFCMGRLDVLAIGDLGIRNGIQKLYGLDHAPLPSEVTAIAGANNWHPYETAACWYIWFSLDNKPAV